MLLKIVRVRSIVFCHFRVVVFVESFWRELSCCELCKSLTRRNEYHCQVMNGNSAKRQLVVCLKPFLHDSSNLNHSIRSIKIGDRANECARGIFPNTCACVLLFSSKVAKSPLLRYISRKIAVRTILKISGNIIIIKLV